MPVFINTRPMVRANHLTHAMQSRGFEVLELPLLEMVSIPISERCIDRLHNLVVEKSADNYDVLVVVSPSAVEFAYKMVTRDFSSLGHQSANVLDSLLKNKFQSFSSSTTVVAVGQATANALAQYGISAIVPKVSSNEGMLNLPEIQQLNSDSTVMIWRGRGGRQLLIDSLQQRGVQVDVIEWYERQLPIQSLQVYQNWRENFLCKHVATRQLINKPPTNQIAIVLISSAEAFENWQLVVSNGHSTGGSDFEAIYQSCQTSLKDFNYIVLGERLAKILDRCSLNYQKIEDLSVASLNQSLQKVME